ncbi:MAG: hypothetical protein U1F43_16835 [Myxococcota bacterium]
MRARPSPLFVTLVVASSGSLAACGDDAPNVADNGSDTTPDTAVDSAAPDATAPDATAPDATAPDATALDADSGADAAVPGELTLSTTGLAFETWDCGSPLPDSRKVTLVNSGGTPASYSVTVGGVWPEWYQIVDAGPGRLEPGASAEIEVRPRWPGGASMPGDKPAILDFEVVAGATYVPNVSLSFHADGAILRSEINNGDFGELLVGAPARSITHAIVNGGDKAATVAITSALDPALTVAFAGSPGPVTLEAGGHLDITATYAPTVAGDDRGSIAFTATGAVCDQRELVPIPLTGKARTGSVLVSGDLDFGDTACLTTASPQLITVSNSSAVAAGFSATAGGFYSVDPSSGLVPAFGTATLTVSSAEVGIYPSYGTSIDGVVVITTDAPGDSPHDVHLTQGTHGAVVRFVDQPFYAQAPLGATAGFDVHLQNSGNVAGTLRLVTSTPELTLDRSDLTIPPGETVAVHAAFTPTASSVRHGAQIAVESTVAGGCRVPEALEGTLVPADVGLSVDTSSLTFAPTLCGSAPGSQFAVVRTTGADAQVTAELVGADATFSLPGGASYSVSRDAGATLIEVAAAPAALDDTPGVRAATLILRVGDRTLREIPLTQVVRGARVSWGSGAIELGNVAVGSDVTYPVTLRNAGNASVQLMVVSSRGDTRIVDLPAGSLAGDSATATFTFTRGSFPLGALAGEVITVTEWGAGANALCGALPGPLPLHGVGVAGELFVSRSALDLGVAPCGQPRNLLDTVAVQNTGLAAVTVAADLLTTAHFAVEPASLELAPGELGLFTVSARPLTTGLPGDVDDVLILTTDIPGDEPRTIGIHMLVRGAIVTLPERVVVPSTPLGSLRLGVPLGITIAGNAPVELAFDDDADDVADELSYTAPVAGPRLGLSHRSYALTYLPSAAGAHSVTVHVSADATAGYLCAPIAPSTFEVEVSASVEGPSLEVAPTLLDLGDTACGASAPAATFTLRNLTAVAQPFAIASERGLDSAYDVSPASGSVPPNGALPVTVTPHAVPSDYRPESLADMTFTVDLSERLVVTSGATRATVDVSQRGYGAAWVFSRVVHDDGRVWATLTSTERLAIGVGGVGFTPAYQLGEAYTGSCGAYASCLFCTAVFIPPVATCGPGVGSIAFSAAATASDLALCSPVGAIETLSYP